MAYSLQYSRLNSYSILIDWPELIDETMLQDVLNYKLGVEKLYNKQKVEVIHTYSSILIIYSVTIDKFNNAVLELKKLYAELKKQIKTTTLLWEIPVCYDAIYGTDLDMFSKLKTLPKSEIIRLHSEAIYTVFFIGFLPGFLYLGGLDSQLYLDRKSTPNLSVKKGSVAIGGNQTGMYPQDSPGGWHVIGNSPVELFNAGKYPPCFIKAGDKLKFYEVDKTQYQKIKAQIAQNNYQIEPKIL